LADFGAARRPNVYGDGKRIHQGNDALSGTEVPFDFHHHFWRNYPMPNVEMSAASEVIPIGWPISD
jgi:hypothetical protein